MPKEGVYVRLCLTAAGDGNVPKEGVCVCMFMCDRGRRGKCAKRRCVCAFMCDHIRDLRVGVGVWVRLQQQERGGNMIFCVYV
jgi:hypothetical protein